MRARLTIIKIISILCCVCVYGIDRPTVKLDNYDAIKLAKEESVELIQGTPQSDVISVEFGCAARNGNLNLELIISDCDNGSILLKILRRDINPGDFDHTPCLHIELYNGKIMIAETDVTSEISNNNSPNFIKFAINDNLLDVSIGKRYLNSVLTCNRPASFRNTICSATLYTHRDVTLVRRTITSLKPKPEHKTTLDSSTNLSYPDGTIWQYLDMDMDYDYARRGGNYKLMARRSNNGIELLYLDGATVSAQNWTPGDLKARLIPTALPDAFEVEWFDSTLNSYYPETFATIEDNIMTINFPLLNTRLRFIRINP